MTSLTLFTGLNNYQHHPEGITGIHDPIAPLGIWDHDIRNAPNPCSAYARTLKHRRGSTDEAAETWAGKKIWLLKSKPSVGG